eukprot:616274-Amphidinium_carterae.1
MDLCSKEVELLKLQQGRQTQHVSAHLFTKRARTRGLGGLLFALLSSPAENETRRLQLKPYSSSWLRFWPPFVTDARQTEPSFWGVGCTRP